MLVGLRWGSAGSVLRSQGSSGGGLGFRASREGKVRSLPMLAPDRSRCRLGTLTLSEQWERRFPMVRGVREACSGAAGGFH